jgi:hypothetical protein
MFRRLLTILLVSGVLAITCGNALGAANSKIWTDDSANGSNNSIVQQQQAGTYENKANTLIENGLATDPFIASLKVKAKIVQTGPGRGRVANQTLAGTNLGGNWGASNASEWIYIKQTGNDQLANQTIRGKGIDATITQSGKENEAEQVVRGYDHEAYITQMGREGTARQFINQGVSLANLDLKSFNLATITQTSRSRKSSAIQTINGFYNEATITQNSGSDNEATQTIRGDQNIATTTQTGSNNTAHTTIEGIDNEVELTQNGNANELTVDVLDDPANAANTYNYVKGTQLGSNNVGTVAINGSQGNNVTLTQNKSTGGLNEGHIVITESDNNRVRLIQKGVDNYGEITLNGDNDGVNNTNQDNDVMLKQIGNSNTGYVNVDDCVHSTIYLTQKGNGLTYTLTAGNLWNSTNNYNQ